MTDNRFYELLGGALYALALSDGTVHRQEKDVLSREIIQLMEQYPGFEDYAGVKKLLITKVCFYNALREEKKVAGLIDDFEEFLIRNKSRIHLESRKVAAHLIRKITEAYKGRTKIETQLMERLLGLLENDGHLNEKQNQT